MSDENGLSIIAPERLEGIAAAQEKQVERFSQLLGRMTNLMMAMESRLSSLENTLKTRVTITYAQSLALSAAVQARTTELCEANGLPEHEAGKTIRAAIWRELCREYGIKNRADLPALYYDQALTYVSGWTSFAAIRRIRDRLGL